MGIFKLAAFRPAICKFSFTKTLKNLPNKVNFRMMSSMAKIFRAGNLTYAPFEIDMKRGNIYEDLKREIGNEHSSECFKLSI